MSATRLLILGLVRLTQPVHGYDVRRELLSWNADEWANVAPGSIYHALKKLTEEGLLREAGTEQVGARPARTMYEITDKGEMVFQELLREFWWEYRQPVDPFLAAFSFLPALPRREAAAALRTRAQQLRSQIAYLTSGLEEGWVDRDRPPHVAEVFRLGIVRMEAEAQWCDRVADRVEAKELPTES
ncbi:MAG TPA: PadR family transcriptional regulator [Micromonosporaceae bacterium]|nr:PadR family transcriptional regulator [Micromonosporaceae bacterium]